MHNNALSAPLAIQPDEPLPRDEHDDGERAAMAQADYVPVPDYYVPPPDDDAPVPKWLRDFRMCDNPDEFEIYGPNTSETPNSSRLPSAAEDRKKIPLCTGLLDYFPDALIEVAKCSWIGNEQHNAGEPLHWAREKSSDHADCLIRHVLERGTTDTDGIRHSAKAAWRALALLQLEIEASK